MTLEKPEIGKKKHLKQKHILMSPIMLDLILVDMNWDFSQQKVQKEKNWKVLFHIGELRKSKKFMTDFYHWEQWKTKNRTTLVAK